MRSKIRKAQREFCSDVGQKVQRDDVFICLSICVCVTRFRFLFLDIFVPLPLFRVSVCRLWAHYLVLEEENKGKSVRNLLQKEATKRAPRFSCPS